MNKKEVIKNQFSEVDIQAQAEKTAGIVPDLFRFED